jgi:hypothetical protein
MSVIDADAHVHECDRTWDFIPEPDRQYKPFVVAGTDGLEQPRDYWVIGGQLRSHGAAGNVGAATPKEYRELSDVEGRLRHMDELGIDVQVLYPSMLTQIASPEVEGALWKGYNRWMGDAWSRGHGRLRWVCRIPLHDMDQAASELRYAKEHGACGVFLRSIEGERFLCDPYFFPIYEELSALDMPVCVHASLGNAQMVRFLTQDRDQGNFHKFKQSVIGAFHSFVVSETPDKFPRLRFGFVEVSSDWVPYVVRELTKRFEWKGWTKKEHILRDNRMYVACQIDDDLPHVLKYAGEDNLVIGTDYGHADTSTDLMAIQELQRREDVEAKVIHKIMDDNARALYGI